MFELRRMMTLALVVLGANVGLQAPVSAASFAGSAPVPDSQLANMRGGFSFGHGIELSIGLDRLAFVNGELDVVTRFQQSGTDGIRVIQNGPGNIVDSSVLDAIPSGTLGTIIQNTVDNQTISNVNVYNISVTSSQIAGSLSLRNSLNDALARFTR